MNELVLADGDVDLWRCRTCVLSVQSGISQPGTGHRLVSRRLDSRFLHLARKGTFNGSQPFFGNKGRRDAWVEECFCEPGCASSGGFFVGILLLFQTIGTLAPLLRRGLRKHE